MDNGPDEEESEEDGPEPPPVLAEHDACLEAVEHEGGQAHSEGEQHLREGVLGEQADDRWAHLGGAPESYSGVEGWAVWGVVPVLKR